MFCWELLKVREWFLSQLFFLLFFSIWNPKQHRWVFFFNKCVQSDWVKYAVLKDVMGRYQRYLYFLIFKQSKIITFLKFHWFFGFALSPVNAWLDQSWTSFTLYSKQMFKSLHSADLHLNWGWLSPVCKSRSTIVALVLVDFSPSHSFNKHTLLI